MILVFSPTIYYLLFIYVYMYILYDIFLKSLILIKFQKLYVTLCYYCYLKVTKYFNGLVEAMCELHVIM